MANIFFLQGFSNRGKTTVLRKMIEVLKEKYHGNIHHLSDEKNKDWLVIFKDVNGRKVGIATLGDDPETVENNVNQLLKEECDIIFSAARTKGYINEVISSFAEKNSVASLSPPMLKI